MTYFEDIVSFEYKQLCVRRRAMNLKRSDTNFKCFGELYVKNEYIEDIGELISEECLAQ